MVCFDKTGTLTQGKPTHTDTCIYHAEFDQEKIMKMLQGLVRQSHHPLSRALVDKEIKIHDAEYDTFREHRGK